MLNAEEGPGSRRQCLPVSRPYLEDSLGGKSSFCSRGEGAECVYCLCRRGEGGFSCLLNVAGLGCRGGVSSTECL